MPHIDVKMFPGRDEDLKKKFAEKVIEAASITLGAPKDDFSVSIEDVDPDRWNEDVADKVNPKDIKAGKMYRK